MMYSRSAVFTTAMALLTLCMGLVQSADAGTIVITRDNNKYSGSPAGMGAGEMGVTTFTGGTSVSMGSGVGISGNLFQTFCLETNESISTGTTLNWSTLGTAATNGGYSGAVGGSDSLDAKTAYLYHQFVSGSLTGYNYTQGNGRVASATSLQLAIWQIEGEIQPGALTTAYNGNSQAQTWVALANSVVASGAWSGIGNVRVINPVASNGDSQQSMLIETTTVVTPVPLPPAALLGMGLMAALGGVGALRRRNRQTLA
jgi:hypothetical protein